MWNLFACQIINPCGREAVSLVDKGLEIFKLLLIELLNNLPERSFRFMIYWTLSKSYLSALGLRL